MGLDFSHTDAHWSYSGFNRFRCRLALEVGITLDDMAGFSGTRPWSEVTDPIAGLLNHSDCEGRLTPKECRVIAPRLKELVGRWADDDYDKQMALELASGMLEAAADNESLEFK